MKRRQTDCLFSQHHIILNIGRNGSNSFIVFRSRAVFLLQLLFIVCVQFSLDVGACLSNLRRAVFVIVAFHAYPYINAISIWKKCL